MLSSLICNDLLPSVMPSNQRREKTLHSLHANQRRRLMKDIRIQFNVPVSKRKHVEQKKLPGLCRPALTSRGSRLIAVCGCVLDGDEG
jgi:hypothetical protein